MHNCVKFGLKMWNYKESVLIMNGALQNMSSSKKDHKQSLLFFKGKCTFMYLLPFSEKIGNYEMAYL